MADPGTLDRGTNSDAPVVTLGACPLPRSRYDHVLLGHGSGGQLSADLIQRLFVPGFGNDVLGARRTRPP